MELSLSHDQMMEIWRLRRGVDPLRADSTITTTYGHNFNAILQAEIDSWYTNLLDTAPPELLATVNIAPDLHLDPTPIPHAAQLTIPPHVRRIFTIALDHWLIPATPQPLDTATTTLRNQHNPFTAATPASPIALLNHKTLLLFPAHPDSIITSLEAVADESPRNYRLDSRALELITPTATMLL